MWWLISLIIAGAIIYYLVVGTRSRDEKTAGVDSGDVLIKPGDGDAELADEFTHFGAGAEFVPDEEYADQVAPNLVGNEGEDLERRGRSDEENGARNELDEYDGDGVEDGMLMGKDTGLRTDGTAIANARSGVEQVDEEVLNNLNIVGDDFGMLMGVNDEVDLDEEHPKRAVDVDRLSAKYTGNDVDEEYGNELFNGGELGGVRREGVTGYTNEHDDADSGTGTPARMGIDHVEDQTYMNAEDVRKETQSKQKRERRRRRNKNHR